MTFIIALITTAILLLTGCASNLLVKNCKQIGDTNGMVCKSTVPWEDFEEVQ